MSKNDARDALHDIMFGLKAVFARYDRSTRKRAWDATQKPEGKRMIDSLLTNPSHQIIGLPRLLSGEKGFKEWFKAQGN
jgi:hypothetical protein